jgi:membrane fusion protein (multidrug efflux system)
MKRIIITVVVLVGAGALITWTLNRNKKENEAKTAVVAQTNAAVIVTAEQVRKQDVQLDFLANGNFAANQDLKMVSEISGRITSLQVKEGSHVSKGQVLAHIDAEVAGLDVQRIEDALAKIKTDQARYKASFETGGVTQAQLDEIDLQLRNTEIQLQQARRRMQDAYVKAPISGVINKRSVEVGTYVSPGTELFEIVDVSKLKLKVTAGESQVVQLKVGDKVKIASSVFADKSFQGTVSFIAVKSDVSLNYPVEIMVDNASGNALKAGMYGTAHFEFPQQAPAIVIPRTAFVGSVSNRKVYVASADGKAQIREVIPGRILGERVEILSGLEEGETVITSGQINLADGMQVEIQKN